MAGERQILGFSCGPVFIPAGISNALAVGFSGANVQVANIIVKYGSGGSLEMFGSSPVVLGAGYLFSTTESLTLGGPASFWLAATGSTVTAFIIQGKTIVPGQS